MIRVTVDEAGARFEELIEAVETAGEIVMLCRDGVEVAEIRGIPKAAKEERSSRFVPSLAPTLASDYDPTEPASEEEWPSESR